MVLVSHPLGNQNVRGVLRGLKDANLLGAFTTSIASFPGSALYKIGSRFTALSEINKRSFDADLKQLTYSWPMMEAARIGSLKLGLRGMVAHEVGRFSVDKLCHYLDNKTAQFISKGAVKNLKAVYGYEDIALNTFEVAKAKGLRTFYDLPIGYWRSARELMQAEISDRPEWAPTLIGFMDSDKKLLRKDDEISKADHVFVASSFTAETLTSFPGKLPAISVIPYGFPTPSVGRIYEDSPTGSLKLLYVGSLSQRKGIANVLEAAKVLGSSIELTIVGRGNIDGCTPLRKGLQQHKYIPGLPHAEILKLMQENDVLLFPSLFEGFGLVITEAMSQGTPVITTNRTCGKDLIDHGKNGWLVPPGDTNALITQVTTLIENRELVSAAGKASLQTASTRPWAAYGRETANKIAELLR